MKVQRLVITLPASHRDGARRIARIVARQLADLNGTAGGSIQSLRIPPIVATRGAGERDLAGRIVASIGASLNRRTGRGRKEGS